MRCMGGSIVNFFTAMPQTTPNAQPASASDAPMQQEKERLEVDKFPKSINFHIPEDENLERGLFRFLSSLARDDLAHRD